MAARCAHSNSMLSAVEPHEIAQHVNDVIFSDDPEVLQEDPVVKWAFTHVPQDQAKDYTFTVDKDIENFDTLAAASAEKPSLLYRMLKWILSFFIIR